MNRRTDGRFSITLEPFLHGDKIGKIDCFIGVVAVVSREIRFGSSSMK
jgi:carbonic anhydrase/acetyltransferase-like protein (isoleucine patch superfamily)